MNDPRTLYLASSLGFSEAGRFALPRLVSALTAAGWTVLDPWADSAHDPLLTAGGPIWLSSGRGGDHLYILFSRKVVLG